MKTIRVLTEGDIYALGLEIAGLLTGRVDEPTMRAVLATIRTLERAAPKDN